MLDWHRLLAYALGVAVVAAILVVAFNRDTAKQPLVPTTAQQIRDRTLPERVLTTPAVCHYRDGGALPDRRCTPGATYSAVTQQTINKTICVSGWTATIRPPVTVTEPEKRKSVKQYGAAFGTSLALYEYDHLVPLELGGAPNDLRNLFPEPHSVSVNGTDEGSHAKDGVENHLKALVCNGKMKLAAARSIMRTDWRKGLTIP